jgi:hypothetical protein
VHGVGPPCPGYAAWIGATRGTVARLLAALDAEERGDVGATERVGRELVELGLLGRDFRASVGGSDPCALRERYGWHGR